MTKEDFTRAVERNNKRIYLLALSYTRDHGDAEDVLQNVFLKLWDKGGKIKEETEIDRWLTTVCLNECRNLLRRPFKKRETLLDECAELYTFDDPRSLNLFRAVMSLSEKERVTVHLFYYEDMPIREIARTLKISENAAKTRLSRARARLKELLGEEWINE